jgi:hypothetical protein
MSSTNGEAQVEKKFKPTDEIGATGLVQFGGRVQEEFLKDLQDVKGRRIYRQMADNDPVVGAILFTVDMLMRQVEWRLDPVDESVEAYEVAEFVESCLSDMSSSWAETLSSVLSFLPFGWSYHELVYKVRRGPDQKDVKLRSKYDDGRIGWRKIAVRSQDTLYKWEFDDDGGTKGMWQQSPPTYELVFIPIEKALLFRTQAHKGNPEGRALDPATPIFTPDGWTTMGELREGDKVFDESGRMRYVSAVAGWEGRPRYRMRFSDGSVIVADGGHQWETTTVSERARRVAARIRSTEEIAQQVKNANGVTNHAVAWAGPLDLPVQSLLIDPYVLGLWLGDGTTLAGSIACHAQDAEETTFLIEQAGYPVKELVNGSSVNGRQLRVYGDLQRDLRVEGVLGDKHVPEQYLRASSGQRLALLQGLMDSDGTVDKDGRCEFTNTNRGLVDAVAGLVRSLGVGCRVSLRKRATDSTREAWCAKFTPTFMPFRLERKRARCKEVRARRFHYIVGCERIEDGPTRCIETDGPSHLFLAGEGLVASHNSILRNAYRPWFFKSRLEEVEAIGMERDLAGLPIAWVPASMLADGATPAETATLGVIKNLVATIKRDEQDGVVFPLSYDEHGNKRYDLTLLSTGGRRQFDTDGVISRYDQRIAMSVLADFILLGHENVGSFALGSSKIDLFGTALGTFLDEVAAVFNRYALPRLMELNDIEFELQPMLSHADVKHVDLTEIAAYLQSLATAGMPLFPDPGLEEHLRTIANFPEHDPDDEVSSVQSEQPIPGQPGAVPPGVVPPVAAPPKGVTPPQLQPSVDAAVAAARPA